jgi:hypothetical protein
MPPLYVAIHLLLAGLCGTVGLRLPEKSRLGPVLGGTVLVVVIGAALLERREDWAYSAMLLRWPDTVFFTNLFLEGAAVLTVGLWRQAADRAARQRALLLAVPLLGAALWSYAWYFAPLPSGLSGTVDPHGYCAQTTPDSCSAAAAVMLLEREGIHTSEAEMARLCLTRKGHGTVPLGLFRGLWLKTVGAGMAPRVVFPRTPVGLNALGRPAILSIGLSGSAPPEIAERLEGYGWARGLRHSVVMLAADPAGKWLEIADPSYGRERWPTADLEYLWEGRALVLSPR